MKQFKNEKSVYKNSDINPKSADENHFNWNVINSL